MICLVNYKNILMENDIRSFCHTWTEYESILVQDYVGVRVSLSVCVYIKCEVTIFKMTLFLHDIYW